MSRLIVVVFFAVNCVSLVICSNCPSNAFYTTQPRTVLPCNPFGIGINLRCIVEALVELQINWYRSLGSTETPLQVLKDSPYYDIAELIVPVDNETSSTVSTLTIIQVNAGTQGFYWCQAENFTSSSFASICPPYNSSLNQCEIVEVITSEQEQCIDFGVNDSPDLPAECVPPSLTVSTITFVSSSPVQFPTFSTQSYLVNPQYSSTSDNTLLISTSKFLYYSTSLSLSSSPSEPLDNTTVTPGSSNTLLFALIGLCTVLGCIAFMIVAAISVLCCLTRGGHHHPEEEEGNKPPTAVLSSDNKVSNGHIDNMENSPRPVDRTEGDDSSIIGSAPVDHATVAGIVQGVSFSNPVYEINCVTLNNPVVIPPKCLPPPPAHDQFSPTPPIFSEDDDKDIIPGKRPYYAKPDLSKKRSRSGTASSQEKDTPPPLGLKYNHNISEMSSNSTKEGIVYDTPGSLSIKNIGYRSVVHHVADYEDARNCRSPLVDETAAVKAGNVPGYDDPWENLPAAIRRSRESTRSRSTQPAAYLPVPNSGVIFDDPAYDVPT